MRAKLWNLVFICLFCLYESYMSSVPTQSSHGHKSFCLSRSPSRICQHCNQHNRTIFGQDYWNSSVLYTLTAVGWALPSAMRNVEVWNGWKQMCFSCFYVFTCSYTCLLCLMLGLYVFHVYTWWLSCFDVFTIKGSIHSTCSVVCRQGAGW